MRRMTSGRTTADNLALIQSRATSPLDRAVADVLGTLAVAEVVGDLAPAGPGACRPCLTCGATVTNNPHGWQAPHHTRCTSPTGRHDGGPTPPRVRV